MDFNKIAFKPFLLEDDCKKSKFFLASPSWHPFISKFHKKIETDDYIICISVVFPFKNGFTYVYWFSRFCTIRSGLNYLKK